MRWVLRMKREADRAGIDAVLAATGERPIVEVSTRDPWWGARPVADRYEGRNVLGRLWMELRHQLRENDPAAGSGAWTGRIRVGCLAGAGAGLDAAPGGRLSSLVTLRALSVRSPLRRHERGRARAGAASSGTGPSPSRPAAAHAQPATAGVPTSCP